MTTSKSIQPFPHFQRLNLIGLLGILLLLATPVSAHGPQAVEHFDGAAAAISAANKISAEKKARAERLTLDLGVLANKYGAATEQAKPQLAAKLTETARERRQLMRELIENDPAEALRLALPERVSSNLPAEARHLLEQRLELEGELLVLHEDHADGSSRFRHFLNVYGERISLNFPGKIPGWLSGTEARANGLLLDDAMALESGDEILMLAADGSGTSGTAAVAPNSFGEQRVAVLMVNFVDVPQEPWTAAEARATVFGEVDGFIKENSFGQTSLAGDVFGWFTLELDPTGCPVTDIVIKTRHAASARGIDLSKYNRVIYAFPRISCSWSGLATVGGQPSQAWFNGTLLNAGVVSHELGHNFGLFHSHAWIWCAEGIGENCTSSEYGDALDRMGFSSGGHFNAFQKARLGWLDYGKSPPIKTADASGVYRLDPYATQNAGTKALRVLKNIDPVTGAPTWYYIEYRQAVGLDSYLTTSDYGDTTSNGLIFRLGTDGAPNSSYLLDMTPNSQRFDWRDMALANGSSFTDPASGATITVEGLYDDYAALSVVFGEAQCSRHNPEITIAPAQGPWVRPGTPVDYDVYVTNKDSAGCADRTVDLAAAVPSDWHTGFSPIALTVSPGASGGTILTVTSDAAAGDGFYPIGVMARMRDNSAFAGSATATYVVANTNQPPVAVDDNGATDPSTAILLKVMNNDYDPDGDTLSLIAVVQPANGSVTFNGDGTLTYAPSGDFTGTDRFEYTISDGKSTARAVVSVDVKKSGGGGNTKGGGGGKGRK